MPEKLSVLVAASGAAWEARALEQLAADGPGLVLLKRCVDLHDLLVSATTGQARVALVAQALPGLDEDSLGLLRRSGIGVVMVVQPATPGAGVAEHAGRLGIEHLVAADELTGLGAAVRAAGEGQPTQPAPVDGAGATDAEAGLAGKVIAVWGPAGAPGRTTIAIGVAAELAHRGRGAFLVDADPYGGAVSQHLGVLDEVSGLLAAARMANAGRLDADRIAAFGRQIAPGFRVLTGLPRADRWLEVRAGAFGQVLDLVATVEPVTVLDTGFCLESGPDDPYGASPQRNAMTLVALDRADEVVVVGSADPVGLARLARGLVELHDTVPAGRVRVVVNRCRGSLGWSEAEIQGMIEGFVTPLGVHFLPYDAVAVDRALLAGRSLVESGDGALRRALTCLVSALDGDPGASSVKRRFARKHRSGG